jgi:Zn-dependent alcohol dehydrogenase
MRRTILLIAKRSYVIWLNKIEIEEKNKMKAAVCYGFNKPLVIEEVDLAAPKRGEVRVRVSATAICHSDLHDIKGDFDGKLPFVPGHETAGYVEEDGANVSSVAPGDAVAVSLLTFCGKCFYCVTGRPNLYETNGRYPLDRINQSIADVERKEAIRNVILF